MTCPPTVEMRKLIKRCKEVVEGKLSFTGGGVGDDGEEDGSYSSPANPIWSNSEDKNKSSKEDKMKRRKVNSKSGLQASKILRIFFLTKNTLLREAQERETLWRDFSALEEKVNNEKISIPLVFYKSTYCASSNFCS